jgi:plastocyanin
LTPEDGSARPDLVGEVRLRVPLPVVVPLAAVLVIFLGTVGFSRILLGISHEAATTIAIATAANILVACAFVALRPSMHRVGVLEVALIALYPILIGVVLVNTGVGSETEAAAGEEGAQAVEEQAPQGTTSGSDIAMSAESLAFSTDQIEIPAREQVTVTLDNQDTVPHDLALYPDEEAGAAQQDALFTGEEVPAGSETTYEFRSPPQGDYYFQCNIHPTMNGEVVVE